MDITGLLAYVTALETPGKINFYNRLGLNLTLCIRSIWSDFNLSDAEKVDAIRVVNEVSHQLLKWINRLLRDDKHFNDQDCFSDISNFARENKRSGDEIGAACFASYRYMINHFLV